MLAKIRHCHFERPLQRCLSKSRRKSTQANIFKCSVSIFSTHLPGGFLVHLLHREERDVLRQCPYLHSPQYSPRHNPVLHLLGKILIKYVSQRHKMEWESFFKVDRGHSHCSGHRWGWKHCQRGHPHTLVSYLLPCIFDNGSSVLLKAALLKRNASLGGGPGGGPGGIKPGGRDDGGPGAIIGGNLK